MTITPLQPFTEDTAPTGSGPAPAEQQPQPRRMSPRERQEQREHNELVAVLNTPEGQAVLLRILDRCKPYHPNNEADAFRQGIREGQRQIGTWLIGIVTKVDPVGYAKLLEQRAQRLERIRSEEAIMADQERVTENAEKPLWQRAVDWAQRRARRAV